MKEPNPQWYTRLKGNPHARKTFTPEKIRQIELLAASGGKRQARRRSLLLWPAAALVSAAVFLIFVFPILEQQSNQPPGGNRPPVDHPDDIAPPVIDQPAGNLLEIDFPEGEPQGTLGELLPFKSEDVTEVEWLHSAESAAIPIPVERKYTVINDLYWVNLDKTLARTEASGNPQTIFRIHTSNGRSWDIPYDVETNTYDISGQRFYANDAVLMMMHNVLDLESPLAAWDRVKEKARLEQESNEGGSVDESFQYDFEQLTVGGKDYESWSKELAESADAAEWTVSYYNDLLGEVQQIRFVAGALTLSLEIIFTSEDYRTPDGIGIGTTREEVTEILGPANLSTETKWSYKVGDYLKFHLYFEDDKVAYLSLTQTM
ncbi:hypothetical protein DNH61_10140 [Paenibacillus sambharensis]|uniref:Uncharacterized protein n=1 Tax=Paenibacillus sambharensis TaxID=1803190 RepID=A0A2W1LLQ8_9BACL|nr:hypothetical protein [Paenibacillus sambharensis]PZD95805.1 hypothetical protein DNH61_10140 [Paenibacillus sambharensis]